MTVVGAGTGAYAGREIDRSMKRGAGCEVRERIEGGSYRTFPQPAQPEVVVGQKVQVADDTVAPR